MAYRTIVNGVELTPDEYAKWSKERTRRLRRAGREIAAGCAPAIDTDTLHMAINRSGLTNEEKEYVAKRARSLGLPEDVAYDPTVPGIPVYEGKAQVERQCSQAIAQADANEGRPKHRLNPRHVENIRRARIIEDPKLAERDQRELREEIIENHSLPT